MVRLVELNQKINSGPPTGFQFLYGAIGGGCNASV